MTISITDEIFSRAKDVIITWFSVLARGPDAFSRINLESTSTLYYSLRFTLYMTFVSFLLHIPAIAKFDLKNLALIQPVWIAETYIEYLAPGLILYGSMKLFGGEASFQTCISAYCLLTAYLPIIAVFMLPSEIFVIRVMRSTPAYPKAIQILAEQMTLLSAWERLGLYLSVLLSTVTFIIYFAAVFRPFRLVHKLNKARALSAFILAMIGSVLFDLFFLEEWISTILTAD